MSTYTDCPTCGRTKRDCDDSAAHGMDACCMRCDETGRQANHAVLTTAALDREDQ